MSDWLKNELEQRLVFKSAEFKQARGGATTVAHTPVTAADTFAEGEFNRFYMRGVCSRAIEEGTSEVRFIGEKKWPGQGPNRNHWSAQKYPPPAAG